MPNMSTIFLVIEQRINDTFKEHHENNAGSTNRLKQKVYCVLLRMAMQALFVWKNLSKKPLWFFLSPHTTEQKCLSILALIKHEWPDPFQCQIVPYIFSSTSLTWDATIFPSTTSSTIVLIFLVLVGSEYHKQNLKKFNRNVKNYRAAHAGEQLHPFPFRSAPCYDELYRVVKQKSTWGFIEKKDFRNKMLFKFYLPWEESSDCVCDLGPVRDELSSVIPCPALLKENQRHTVLQAVRQDPAELPFRAGVDRWWEMLSRMARSLSPGVSVLLRNHRTSLTDFWWTYTCFTCFYLGRTLLGRTDQRSCFL